MCSIWDPYLIKDKDILDKVHRRGAIFVCNNYRRDSSVTGMLESLGWDSLESRRCKSRINMMGKIVGSRVAINSEDYLISGNTRTRSANSAKFRTIGAKSNVYKNSFFPRTIPTWNQTTDADVAEIVAYCSSTSLD